ncbi:DUF222 domain-containing protein [Blastococcus sp. SYSU D00820]
MCSTVDPGGDVLDVIAAGVAERNRRDAALTRQVRAAELAQAAERDGLKAMTSWLKGHCRMAGPEALRLVRNGRALEHLPALAEAFAAGLVSAQQVHVAADAVTPARLAAAAAQGVDLAVIDAVLTQVAIDQPVEDLVKVVKKYVDNLDPDGPEPDPTELRELHLTRNGDGTLSIRGLLDPVAGEKLQTAIEAHTQADRPAGDERTRAQRQADALVQVVDNALASGSLPVLRTRKPQVLATIPLSDLASADVSRGAGRMGFGAGISAARARWLACDGEITRLVMGPDGQPLDVGRTARVVPPHLRRAVEARDGACVFAGCTAPTHRCDVHHLVHWIDGGATSLDNSALLCERHHTTVHSGFRVERQPDADGAPGAPTAARSPPPHRCAPPPPDPSTV